MGFAEFALENLTVYQKHQGIIPLVLYGFQKRLVDEIESNKYLIVKKFRSGGFTTLSIAFAIWKCHLGGKQKFLFLTRSVREAINLRMMAQQMLVNVADYKEISESKIVMDNGSSLNFFAHHEVHPDTYTHVFIDEAAFIPDMEYHWKNLMTISESLGCAAKYVVMSTPNSTNNWFYKTYLQAVRGTNSFVPFYCDYLENPNCKTPGWVGNMMESMDAEDFLQEVAGVFIAESDIMTSSPYNL